MALSNEDVAEIIRLLDEMAATELRVRTRNYDLTLRRADPEGEWVQSTTVLGESLVEAAAEPARGPTPGATTEPTPEPISEPTSDRDGMKPVRAPLMGTFYRAPMPGAPPFVEVGARVEPDTVVGIVETMKLMTSVRAGVPGRVREICLDNDQFAEQGAVLMWIGPAA